MVYFHTKLLVGFLHTSIPIYKKACRGVIMITSLTCDVESQAKSKRLVTAQSQGNESPSRKAQVVICCTCCVIWHAINAKRHIKDTLLFNQAPLNEFRSHRSTSKSSSWNHFSCSLDQINWAPSQTSQTLVLHCTHGYWKTAGLHPESNVIIVFYKISFG